MTSQTLTQRQQEALARVGFEWQRVHRDLGLNMNTVTALEERGLVETSYVGGLLDDFDIRLTAEGADLASPSEGGVGPR